MGGHWTGAHVAGYADVCMITSATAREHLFTFEEYVRIAEHSPMRLEF
jgi:hypothetical protein